MSIEIRFKLDDVTDVIIKEEVVSMGIRYYKEALSEFGPSPLLSDSKDPGR